MLLASSSQDIKFHSWPEGKLVYAYEPLSEPNGTVKSISWSKEGLWLVLTPSNGKPEILTLKSKPKLLSTVQEVQEPNCTAFANSSKKHIGVGTINGQVLIYDVKIKSVKKTFNRLPSSVSALEYTADDSHLVAAYKNGFVQLYNCVLCKASDSYKVPKSKTISALRCHPKARNLICCGTDEGIMAVWDINTSKTRANVQAHAAPITDISFFGDSSNAIISLGIDRKLCLYDFISNKTVVRIQHNIALTSIDFHPDGKTFAAADINGNISAYDSRTLKHPMKIFHAHQRPIKKILFQKVPKDSKISQSQSIESIDCGETSANLASSTKTPIICKDSFGMLISSGTLSSVDNSSNIRRSSVTNEDLTDSFLGTVINSPASEAAKEKSHTCGEVSGQATKLQLTIKAEENSASLNISPLILNKPLQNLINEDSQFKTPLQPSSTSRLNIPLTINKQPSSTPKYAVSPAVNNDSPIVGNMSPIVSSSNNQDNDICSKWIQKVRDDLKEMRTEMKEFKEEMRREMAELTTKMRHEMYDVARGTNMNMLGFEFKMIQEFHKVDGKLDLLLHSYDSI